MNIASYIDHTALKPTTERKDVDKLCAEALEYHFAAVCVPPVFVAQAAHLLRSSGVKVATVVGFPFGYTYPEVKLAEAYQAINNGAQEIDVVHNIGALKSGDFPALEKEATQLLSVVKKGGSLLKIIIETGLLTNSEIEACCSLYGGLGVHFVKTSTGYAEEGATVEAVQLMRRYLPSTSKIKASGGIKTFEFAKSLVEAGADRIGCSAGVAIVKGMSENDKNLY